MIVVMKKSNVLLVSMIFVLALAILSLNIGGGNASPVNNTSAQQRTIMLDPGHGGEDPGAVSDYNSLKEKDINLGIV